MKTIKSIIFSLSFFLPLLINAQCLTVNLQTRSYNGYEVSCYSATDGSIIASVQGSSLSYNYEWSNGETTSVINGLRSGNYTLTVTDNNGCSQITSISLTAPSPLVIDANTLINDTGFDILCNGDNSGVGIADVSGGIGSYRYRWSNGDVTQTISGLGGGTYNITVTDQNGCESQSSIQIIEPSPINLNVFVKLKSNGNHLSYTGANDGEVIAMVSGGMGFYSFEWSNGYIGDTLTNIGAGVYSVTVIDMYGCSQTQNVEVLNPQMYTISNTPTTSNNTIGTNIRGNQLRPITIQIIDFDSNELNKNYEENILTILDENENLVLEYNNVTNVNSIEVLLKTGKYLAKLSYKNEKGEIETILNQITIK